MVRRNAIFIFGLGIFFVSLLLMLKQLDGQQGQEYIKSSVDGMSNLNSKLSTLEHELQENKLAMVKLRNDFGDLVELSRVAAGKSSDRKEVLELIGQKELNAGKQSLKFPKSDFNFTVGKFPACQELNYNGPNCDIEMNNMYGDMDWADTNGGVWKQGFSIDTNDEEWNGRKLRVFVVPHSHNDPGWLKTYEAYFNAQTRHILDNMVDHLSLDSKRRFIWAEMSYLSMWYGIADEVRKAKLRNLIKNGQFEIVTGGWVMNDEANTHIFGMIDQMIEGHEWASRTFNVIPKSSWAIDPFGHTPTMAYLLKKMGLTNMLIQRIHYSVKKRLAKDKNLEFRWRQQWDSGSSTDMTCHMMPFYSYDVPHTCGPDPKICCQFDFGRLQGQRRNCPWGIAPRAITPSNVEERSKTLLDQYRKKAKLFRTDTLLVILGDDFRYDKMAEVEAQFTNYASLFDYVNSHPELNAELSFGTLSEYFDAMEKNAGGAEKLPSLAGDFFTYSDREDHYWSGYYTSRPFYKTQERTLEAHLRGAEILFSLALPVARKNGLGEVMSKKLYPLLKEARRNLGLFQHHDGITGTAKDPVVVDYGIKLMTSVMNSKSVIARSAELLLSRSPASYNVDSRLVVDFDSLMTSHNSLPEKVVIVLDKMSNSGTLLILYNSLAYDRIGLVRVVVSSEFVKVTNERNEIVPSQVNLIWTGPTAARLDQFELVFVGSVAATGLATYQISYQRSSPQNTLSSVDLYNTPDGASLPQNPDFTVVTKHAVGEDLQIENEELSVSFCSENGLMRSITTKRDGIKTPVDIDFAVYQSRTTKEKSGAYLFLPNGPATDHVKKDSRPLFRVVNGPLLKEVQVLLPNLVHTVALHRTDDRGPAPFGVHVTNRVDIKVGFDNRELTMRVTAPEAGDADNVFYTDLNGFQIQKRKTNLKNQPLQANFFPMPTMAFTQNDKTRLSVLSGQPRGVSSLIPGRIEVVMDRRLMQDDNRGVGQGVKDNVPSKDNYVILVERWKNTPGKPDVASNNQYPSTVAHHALLEILHPMWAMRYKDIDSEQTYKLFQENFRPWPGSNPGRDPPLPCSYHLVNLRSVESRETEGMASDESALILHNFGSECHLDTCTLYKASCLASTGSPIPVSILYPVTSIRSTSLSLQYDDETLHPDAEFSVDPMEIKSFKIELK